MSTPNDSVTKRAETSFVCACKDEAKLACTNESFYEEHEGKKYCVLHFPAPKKLEAFHSALKRKLDIQDFDFREIWFPEKVDFSDITFNANAYFNGATFSADIDFSGATFSAPAYFVGGIFNASADFLNAEFNKSADFTNVNFSSHVEFINTNFSTETDFSNATFGEYADFIGAAFIAEVSFRDATFSANAGFSDSIFCACANFSSATFSAAADFNAATFAEANFSGAIFSAEADFRDATFGTIASFEGVTFKNYVSFAGLDEKKVFSEQSRLDFQFSRVEKPERVSFHTLYLRPHWFINADCRKFEFTDCEWNFDLKAELEGASKAEISAPHRLLEITYRQLADNAEANHRYDDASRFRFNAFEARRIEKSRGAISRLLDWLYRNASGYGESVERAFIVFVILLALFAFGYWRCGFDQSSKATSAGVSQAAAIQPDTIGKPLDWKDAFIYSFNVTILQKPKPEPLTRTAKLLVSLETVLGPAQAALLALAVRRRFMR